MAVNPAIAMGFRGIELQDPLAQYSRVMAIQGAQQQNALAQRQMEQAERELEQQNKLREFLPTLTPENRSQLLGYGAAGRQTYETLLKGEKESREAEKAAAEIAASRMKQVRDLLPAVNSPEAYANWRNYTIKQLPGLGNLIPEQYSPDTTRMLMLEADKALEQHFVTQDTGGGTRVMTMPKYGRGPATVVPGTEARKTLAPGEAQRLKLEGERIGLEGRRVAVLEENQRRDSDPEFQQRMEAARTVGRKAAEGDIAAQRALPKAITRAEEGIRLVNELIGERDEKGRLLKYASPHPGFESVVGATWAPGLRFVPGTDSAGFMARFDQIKGASFLEAFESLKGGGAITEKEGSKATEAINRMSIATNEREFVRAAMDLQDVMRKGVQRAQELAGRGAPSKPAAPTGGVDMNNPLLK